MPPEIEQLPNLAGFLKLVSNPVWVASHIHTTAVVPRERRESV
jgi:hypothetical protein